jgi:acetylglutamate kinase
MPRARRVYKVGGPALEDPSLLAPLAKELGGFDGEAAVVHGGGRQVEKLLQQLGIESKFINGRRETSPAAMAVV